MRGNIVRSEEWVVMRYNSVLDLHTHTLVSGHAYCSLREMAKAAADKGLEVLGITEHAPAMPGTCHKYYFENLKIVPREMYGIQLLLGSEVNILDAQGTVDLVQRTLERMDVVIASLHMPCMKPGSKLENTESYLNVMKNPYVNIIGHPDDGRYEIDYEALIQGAKEYGKVLELNNHSMDPDCNRQNAVENDTVMLNLCKKYQVPVIALAGAVTEDADLLYEMGVSAMFGINRRALSFEELKATTKMDLRKTAESIFRLMDLSSKV